MSRAKQLLAQIHDGEIANWSDEAYTKQERNNCHPLEDLFMKQKYKSWLRDAVKIMTEGDLDECINLVAEMAKHAGWVDGKTATSAPVNPIDESTSVEATITEKDRWNTCLD